MKPTVQPITDADVGRAAAFLHRCLNPRIPAGQWEANLRARWVDDAPNHGFQLVADDAVVGVYAAFYSERLIRGRAERFCNLAAWCVEPAHRVGAVRLLKALLAQEGYHFTDFSPSGNVVAMNQRLGFRALDTTTALVPNLPWPARGCQVVDDPAGIAAALSGEQLAIYRDHAGTSAARHVVLRRGGSSCYVLFRKDRRKNLPLFASILHVSDPAVVADLFRPLSRYLLVRHRAAATLAELRVVGHRPSPSFPLRSPRTKMFRSADLSPDDVDYLYSELTCVAW